MSLQFDFSNSVIDILYPQRNLDVQSLYDAVREAEASEEGIQYASIADGSGKESLGGDVQVGITLQLLGDWQLRFYAGEYIAKVSGGNLVTVREDGDAVAYSDGVQVLIIQSAASTVVTSGGSSSSGALTQEQEDALYAAAQEAQSAATDASLAKTAAQTAATNANLAMVAAQTVAESTGDILTNVGLTVTETQKTRKMLTNKAVISVDKAHVEIMDDDGVTVIQRFEISPDKLSRTPV